MVKQVSIIFPNSYAGIIYGIWYNIYVIIDVLHGFLKIFIGDCGEPRPQTTLEIIMLHGVCFNGQFHWFSDIL